MNLCGQRIVFRILLCLFSSGTSEIGHRTMDIGTEAVAAAASRSTVYTPMAFKCCVYSVEQLMVVRV